MKRSGHIEGARVLVTGAGGFLGQRVVAELLTVDAIPIGLGLDSDVDQHGVEFHALDLAGRSAVEMADVRADLMVHLAARSGGIQLQLGGESLFDVNTRITSNALRIAIAAGVRRIFVASSAVVYPPSERTLHLESDPVLNPAHDDVSEYAWSKLTDEARARWYAATGATEVVIGRFANVFGPGGSFDPSRSTVIHALIKRLVDSSDEEPLEVWGSGSAERTFIYIADAARAVVRVLADGEPDETYNVSSGLPISVRELAQAVIARSGLNRTIRFLPDKPEGPRFRLLDATKLQMLGFEAEVSLNHGIDRTLEYYRRVS